MIMMISVVINAVPIKMNAVTSYCELRSTEKLEIIATSTIIEFSEIVRY